MLNRRLLGKLESQVEPFAAKIYQRGIVVNAKKEAPSWENLSINEKEFFLRLSADTLFVLSLYEEEDTLARIVYF